MHWLVRKLKLADNIDDRLQVLKAHRPYQESDHVLSMAYNILCGGRCIEDLERLRQDEALLDALGADRIPDPTTAGDFCRRFESDDIDSLMAAINETRVDVWRRQPTEFLDEAIIDADGTLVETSGSCKEGIELNYKGQWGYQTLLVSLANTQESLFLESKTGARQSQEGAAARLDQARALCRKAGFRSILMRGDTAFSQTAHLDRWDAEGARFVFGYQARKSLIQRAESLDETSWKKLARKPQYVRKGPRRSRPTNVRDAIVREQEYRNIRLEEEHVAELNHSPEKCKNSYRLVVVRKSLSIEKGQRFLAPEIRYLFYITNDRRMSARDVVFTANQRCAQEGLIGELKDGVHALRAPVGSLLSNWAFMVMASLAWTLKAWYALLLPVTARWREKHQNEQRTVLRMGFRKFVNAFLMVPAQVVHSSRQIRIRLLAWNNWQMTFLRALDGIRQLR